MGSPADGFRAAGAVHPLENIDRVRFGRATGAALVLDREGSTLHVGVPSPWVSGAHASLVAEAGRWHARDEGSKNGVLVDGVPIDDARALRPGEVLEIGRSFWAIQHGPVALATTPLPAPHATTVPRLRQAILHLDRLAGHDVSVLIHGETGTGKSELAAWLHARGRRTGELVVVDLATGSIERKLLGDRGGSGPLARAAEGTLVLDDVGELDAQAQAELSSVLLGRLPRTTLVSTSQRDLQVGVIEGNFRADVLSRLAGYTVSLPPLRARRADLGLLTRSMCRTSDGEAVAVSVEVFRAMLQHEWPFNLRQLQHSLAAAAAVAGPEGVTQDVWRQVAWDIDATTTPRRLTAVRRELLQQLSRHGGELDRVAAALGCERGDVERWLRRFALSPEGFGTRG